MKIKNLEKYSRYYRTISSDSYKRVKEYLEKHKFRKKDIEQFHKSIQEALNENKNEKVIKIVFDIIPEATPRPRLGRHGVFYVKDAHNNHQYTEVMVRDNRDILGLIKTPCELHVYNYMEIPKTFNKVNTLLAELGFIRPCTKPDWDNLGKTYSDMIQNWLIHDDSLIISGHSYKYYSLKPRVEIIIRY